MSDKSQGPEALELTKFVEGLLTQMRSRFDKMSDSVIAKVDEMGHRIDSLEKDITALVDQAGSATGPADTGNAASKS